jgi:hypothetical protein
MRETTISLPELGLIGGTRVALGAGLGLLLADRLTTEQRRAVGWTLLAVGVATTIPLALEVLGGGRLTAGERQHEAKDAQRSTTDGRHDRERVLAPT